MAVTSSTLVPGFYHQDTTSQQVYRHIYSVLTDSTTMSPPAVIAGAQGASPNAVPRKGDRWTYGGFTNNSAICQSITAQQNPKDWSTWRIEAEWSPIQGGQIGGPTGNPLTEGTRYWCDDVTYTEALWFDRFGDPILNSAGQRFDTTPEIDISRFILMARKNFASWQQIVSLNVSHANTVNSVPYAGRGARQWYCRPIKCSERKEYEGIGYYVGIYRLELNPSTWDLKLLNTGMEAYNNTSDKELENVTDRNGNQLDAPQFLNSDGTQKHFAEAFDPAEHVKTFEIRGVSNFATLGI